MDQALVWINELSAWRMTYSDFLREMTIDEFETNALHAGVCLKRIIIMASD